MFDHLADILLESSNVRRFLVPVFPFHLEKSGDNHKKIHGISYAEIIPESLQLSADQINL